LVIFAAQYNAGGTGGTISLSDNRSHTYGSVIRRVDDDDPSANMSLYVFCLPRITTGGSLTLTGTFAQVEWQALFVMEVSGLLASPVLASASAVTTATGTTTDSLSGGSLVAGSNRGIVISVCLNGTDQNLANSGGVGSPNIGTGYTAINSGVINWNGEENSFVGPAAACEYKIFTGNIGTTSPTFTPKKAGESYMAVSVALGY
jgi:hypothetical protein